MWLHMPELPRAIAGKAWEKNEHGFAHHSDTRGANLNICYMVILYKLAEQIIQTKKKNSCSIILRHLSRKGY